jgi:hypothetical protein
MYLEWSRVATGKNKHVRLIAFAQVSRGCFIRCFEAVRFEF